MAPEVVVPPTLLQANKRVGREYLRLRPAQSAGALVSEAYGGSSVPRSTIPQPRLIPSQLAQPVSDDLA